MPTVIASIALVVIVSWAIYYLVKQKRAGRRCLGCALESGCSVKKPSCCSSNGGETNKPVLLEMPKLKQER